MSASSPPHTRDKREISLEGNPPLAGNVVIPEDCRGMIVILGDSARDSVLGRLALPLQEAQFGTMILHAYPDPKHGRVADLPVVNPDGIARAIDWLRREPRTKGLKYGLLLSGRAVSSGLRAVADHQAPIAAVACFQGRFAPEADYLTSAGVPVLLMIEDVEPELVDINEKALNPLPDEKAMQLLRSPDRSAEERLHDASVTLVRWFGSRLAGSSTS